MTGEAETGGDADPGVGMTRMMPPLTRTTPGAEVDDEEDDGCACWFD
jgi:hypothetical protein